MKNKLININQHNPCRPGLDYYNSFNSTKEFWEQCNRGDWMLWFATKINVNIQTLTLAKAYCAKTVYHLLTDNRSREAIVTAINFGRGLATIQELNTAAADAAYAAAAAAADADAAAADAAAADAAYAAADAAAAYAAAAAAAYAAYAADDARIKNQLKTANICKKYLTTEVFKILKIK